MLILSVDPGLTSGLAFNIDGRYETLTQPEKREIFDLVLSTPFDVIVCEQFITSQIHSHKYGIYTAELVGALEALAYASKIPFHRRTNHQRKPLEQRAKEILKAKYRPYTDHELSALSHLLSWEKFNSNVIATKT